MVTLNPATIAGLADRLGRIHPGYLADLVVVRGNPQRPYQSLVDAKVQDVQLVMIGGQPHYGAPEIMNTLGQGQDSEQLEICHERKLLHLHHHKPSENPLNITHQELLVRLTSAMTSLPEPKPVLAPLFGCR